MPEKNQHKTTALIAVGGFLITVASFLYSIHQDQVASGKEAELVRINSSKDSIEQVHQAESDSLSNTKEYQTKVDNYDKEAQDLSFANENSADADNNTLELYNESDSTLSFAICYRGMNKVWFVYGYTDLQAHESTSMSAIDVNSDIYIYPDTDNPILINDEAVENLSKESFYLDSTNSFLFLQSKPAPHKAGAWRDFFSINLKSKNKVYFTNP
jgi:hypothetical protein